MTPAHLITGRRMWIARSPAGTYRFVGDVPPALRGIAAPRIIDAAAHAVRHGYGPVDVLNED